LHFESSSLKIIAISASPKYWEKDKNHSRFHVPLTESSMLSNKCHMKQSCINSNRNDTDKW